MPIVVPPGTGVEGLVLAGLDLAQGANGAIQLDAFTPPLFKKRPEWIEAADGDGAILARDPLIAVGQAVVRLGIAGVNRDDSNAIIWSIVHKLEEAERNPGGIPLVWTPGDSTTSGTCYVLTGEITDLPVDWESGYMAAQPTITVALDCKPGWYGDPVVYGPVTAAGPLVELELEDVPGDVPAEAVLTVTEMSSQSRRTVEWGGEYRHYDPADPWDLVLDSDALVTSAFAGTQTTLAGAYDPGAAGNSIIVSTVATSPQAICGTGAQPHIGTFRVKLRMNTGPAGCTDVRIRFAWRVGDGSYRTNDPVLLTDPTQEYLELDLGLITIPEASAGTQSWDGRVEAWRLTDSDTLYIDYLMLIPVEAGYGKATASYSYSPGVISARDAFSGLGSGAALNARTPDAGAAWATSGVATDFTGDTTALSQSAQPRVKRATVSDAGFRWAVFGTAMTDQRIESRCWTSSATATGAVQALIARWVDASNHLRLQWVGIPGSGTLQLVKVVAGVETVLASTSGHESGEQVQLSLLVLASGLVIASDLPWPWTAAVELHATDSALATGGALASGKAGIADVGGTPAQTRYYDDITVEAPAAEPIVMYSGRKFAIRHDTVERESGAGSVWGRPQSYRGSRFYVQPAGTEDRTTRVVAKASRNNLAVAADDNLTDQIKLEATVTPRYSVIPGA